MKKFTYLLVAMMTAVMTLGLAACGDDDNDEPNPQTYQHIQVDGQNWDLSNSHPPVFNSTSSDNENEPDLIFTHFIKKLNPDNWYEYYDRPGEIYDINLDIHGPAGIRSGVNLLDDPQTWSIDISYCHGYNYGSDIDFDNPPEDFFLADYRYLNPSRFGQSSPSSYSGSIVIKEFKKNQSMTIEFNNFTLTGYVEGSWGPKLSDHHKIVLNGTVTYEYNEVTW